MARGLGWQAAALVYTCQILSGSRADWHGKWGRVEGPWVARPTNSSSCALTAEGRKLRPREGQQLSHGCTGGRLAEPGFPPKTVCETLPRPPSRVGGTAGKAGTRGITGRRCPVTGSDLPVAESMQAADHPRAGADAQEGPRRRAAHGHPLRLLRRRPRPEHQPAGRGGAGAAISVR